VFVFILVSPVVVLSVRRYFPGDHTTRQPAIL
jgi:hypothetical protein